jgi:hypothetical protein
MLHNEHVLAYYRHKTICHADARNRAIECGWPTIARYREALAINWAFKWSDEVELAGVFDVKGGMA